MSRIHRWPGLTFPLLLLASLLLPGCPADGSGGAENAAPQSEVKEASADGHEGHDHARRGRPLPAFRGTTLDGGMLDLRDWVGRRGVLFFFNPSARGAAEAAQALARVAGQQAAENFQILGVAQGRGGQAAQQFLRAQGLDIPALEDASGALSSRIGLRSPVALLWVDAQGSVVGGTDHIPDSGDPVAVVENAIREWLRLPEPGASDLEAPAAPLFEAERLEGGERFELAELAGRPVALIFFLHTCPHCHDALNFFKKELPRIPEEARPVLLGVSVVNRVHSVRQSLQEDGLDFFPVLLDGDGSIQRSYGVLGGVPVIVLIDAEGRIQARSTGWRADRDPALIKMQLAKISGQRVPMLLHKSGYSGNEFCVVCHEDQEQTWELTNHATAFDTLVRHGADHDGECVSCHVVGYGEPGGYQMARPSPALENVGCESCHGRGGPHLSPDFVQEHDYEAVCTTCHNPQHSLGFDYAGFLPRVSHAANLQFAGLSPEEKSALLEKRRKTRTGLLPSKAAYVGSQACQSCHSAEHATWERHPHAKSIASLEAKGKAGEGECLSCHTTGYGQEGAFPTGGDPASHTDFAAVGCESCHGPGGDHVAPDAPRRGTILSLGDKCDSCVILQICGSCHDDANDPGFEFEVQEKIEHQRHGTIEAGTGRPLGDQAGLASSTVVGLLDRAFQTDAELGWPETREPPWTAR